MVKVDIYAAERSEDLLFKKFEERFAKELVKAGYTIAECKSNFDFKSPRIQVEAYNYDNQNYINRSFHMTPAMQGLDFAWIPAMRFLRAIIEL